MKPTHLHPVLEFLCRPAEQCLEVMCHTGDTEAYPYEPGDWRQRPEQIYSILEKADREMVFLASQHVEGFPKGEIAHDIEGVEIEQLRHVDRGLV